jgi:hypothetical protein
LRPGYVAEPGHNDDQAAKLADDRSGWSARDAIGSAIVQQVAYAERLGDARAMHEVRH